MTEAWRGEGVLEVETGTGLLVVVGVEKHRSMSVRGLVLLVTVGGVVPSSRNELWDFKGLLSRVTLAEFSDGLAALG